MTGEGFNRWYYTIIGYHIGLVWDGSNAGKGGFFFDVEENGKKIPVYKYASKANQSFFWKSS